MSEPSTIPAAPDAARESFPHFTWRIFALLGCLFVVAVFLDTPISTWVHDNGISAWFKNPSGHQLALVLRFPGRGYFPLAACVLLILVAFLRRNAAALDAAILIALSGIFSGINFALKWAFGRTRPFHDVGDIHNVPPFHLIPFRGGAYGFFHAEQNLSFPSGDASLAFAMTAALCLLAPRWAVLWWIMGIMVAVERVLEGAHYPTDVTAGAALGIACAIVARRLIRRPVHFPAQKGI